MQKKEKPFSSVKHAFHSAVFTVECAPTYTTNAVYIFIKFLSQKNTRTSLR